MSTRTCINTRSPSTRSTLLALAALCVLSFFRADAAVVPVDSTAYGPMDGFELYGNGLYWWNGGNPANEIFPARVGQVAIRSLVAGRFLVTRDTRTTFSIQTTSMRSFAQGVGRTDESIFYFGNFGAGLRIHRRPAYGAAANDSGIDFSGVAYNEAGAILVSGPHVYWTARGGSAADNGEIRRKAVDGPPGGGDSILANGVGHVIKMRIVQIVDTDGNFFRSYLFLLNDLGQLWRIRLPTIFQPTLGALSLFATNVTDFDWRDETTQEFVPPFLFRFVHGTRLYAATGVTLSDSRLSGRVVSFNLTDGTSSTFYDSQNVNLQVTGVAVDGDRIFITRTPLRFEGVVGGFGGWVYDRPNSQIMRQNYPANQGIFQTGPMESIAILQEGRNLRSDGQWLYFTHDNQLRKIKTDSPALALDYRAIGLEAVQAVQDYNNSVALVSGKPTLVRAYAQQLQNTTGIARFPLSGRLRAFRNGVQLPAEALSYNDPTVDGASDLPTLRTNLNRAFLFDLPDEWLNQDGGLTLEFMVNPNGTAPETGAAPLLNNVVTANVSVAHRTSPCLTFVVMDSVFPAYNPNASDSLFGDILDRALTLLPVPGFRYTMMGGQLSKPVVTITGIKWRSFQIPSDTSWALTLLSAVQWLSKDPAGCPANHWVGMFPSAETNFNGQGEAPGNTLVIRMGADNNGNWQGPRGGYALAHELSHNYGRNHIATPTNCTSQVPAKPFDSYNGSACTLGNPTSLTDPATPIGYDYRSGTLILPTMAGDLMTYANSRWMSPQTWQRDLDTIPTAPASGLAPAGLPPGPVLFVQGLLDTTLPSGVLLPLLQLQPTDVDSSKVQSSIAAASALPPTVPYRLRLLNAAGNVLSDVAAVTSAMTDEEPSKLKIAQFISLDPAATKLQLLVNGVVIAETTASANAPSLILNVPIVDGANETLALTWTASDLDNDPLLYTVQFSPNNGATWQTLRVHDPSQTFVISTKLLPGGTACRLRVIVTDGFHTTMAMTDPFALGKHAPIITVVGLHEGQRLPFGTNLNVRAFAYDPEDGSIESADIQWQLAGAQARSGRGDSFSLSFLAPGAYALTVSTTDAEGNPGSRVVPFIVQPLVVPDTAEPVLDGLCVDLAYQSVPSARVFPGLPEPSVKFVHAGSALFVCFNGLPRSDDDAVPANVSFYINPDGTPDTAPQSDDQGFGVDENGVPARSRGNGSGFVSQLPQDFSVQIFQSIGTWNAEFRIPDSLLGGWNRDAGIAVSFGRSYCVQIPFVGCVSVPLPPTFWPETSDPNHPNTWASARFGAPTVPPNLPPVAVASAPAVVSFNEPKSIGLNGLASYDPDGDPLTYTWVQSAGPGVALDDPASATPSFTTPAISAETTLTFQLMVNDGQSVSLPAAVSILLVPVNTSSSPSGNTGGGIKTPVVFNEDGSARIQLCWPGTPGDVAIIQASTDLIHWDDIAMKTVGALDTVLHLDLAAGNYAHRFYRAVSAPTGSTLNPAGTALQFDGTHGWVTVNHAARLDAFPLTVAFWLRTGLVDGNVRGLVSKYGDSSFNGFSLFLHGGRVRGWYFRNSSSYLWDGALGWDSGPIADGQWHHMVLVVDGASGRLYRDGSLVSTLPWVGLPGAPTTAEPLQFGRYFNYPVTLDGQLDEIAIWNRALSETELNQLVPGKMTGSETGLVGFWPFDEASGDSATDVSNHGSTGLLVDNPTWVNSTAPLAENPSAGHALRFDGVDDRVEISGGSSLNPFPLTVTAWVRTWQVSPGYVSIANKYQGGSGNGYSVHLHDGRVYAFYFRGDGLSYVYAVDPGMDGGFIADGQWHHVAFVVDDDGGRILVDGNLTASLPWVGTPGACTTAVPLRFGYYPLNGQTISLDGRMDNVTLWNRALTAGEVNTMRRFSIAGTESGLVGFWPLDAQAGTAAVDASGHGNNGVLVNGPIWVKSDLPVLP